jgi:hypothetical protein
MNVVLIGVSLAAGDLTSYVGSPVLFMGLATLAAAALLPAIFALVPSPFRVAANGPCRPTTRARRLSPPGLLAALPSPNAAADPRSRLVVRRVGARPVPVLPETPPTFPGAIPPLFGTDRLTVPVRVATRPPRRLRGLVPTRN